MGDDQIRTLKDEIAHQGDMITKLGKEKRSCADGRQKTEEDIQAAEDKCNHLSRVKGKLEQALDEAEDALEREKKVKGDVDKAKRKVEGDLKLTQEAVSDLERVKKQLEGEINELEIGLDHGNKANSEGLKSIKRYQTQLRETIQAFEDEARSKAQIIEQVGISERKSAALSGEVEESKALLDGANRAIRQLQNDIADSRSAVNNMQTINARDMTGKRQLESSIHTLQAEVDGMLVAAKNAEDKAKKAMVDAARLADELRAEQEHVGTLGTGKNSLSNALGELEGRLSDAENVALKSGKSAMAKLEGKIRELEAELAATQSRTGEANKTYKQQIEEAEEIAALNLAKFRKAQQELEETEE